MIGTSREDLTGLTGPFQQSFLLTESEGESFECIGDAAAKRTNGSHGNDGDQRDHQAVLHHRGTFFTNQQTTNSRNEL